MTQLVHSSFSAEQCLILGWLLIKINWKKNSNLIQLQVDQFEVLRCDTVQYFC